MIIHKTTLILIIFLLVPVWTEGETKLSADEFAYLLQLAQSDSNEETLARAIACLGYVPPGKQRQRVSKFLHTQLAQHPAHFLITSTIIDSLAKISSHPQQLVSLLLPFLRSPQEEIRAAVAKAALKFPPDSVVAVKALVQALWDEPTSFVQRILLRSLPHFHVGEEYTIAVLCFFLEKGENHVRAAAASSLGKLPTTPSKQQRHILPALQKCLREDTGEAKFATLEVLPLLQVNSSLFLADVVRFLAYSDTAALARHCLSQVIKSSTQMRLLLEDFSQQPLRVQKNLIALCGKLPEQSSISVPFLLANWQNKQLQNHISRSLVQLGSQTVPSLVAYLKKQPLKPEMKQLVLETIKRAYSQKTKLWKTTPAR